MIETERLELYPLTSHQLKLWIEDIPALEEELNCSYEAEPMEGFLLEIVKEQIMKLQQTTILKCTQIRLIIRRVLKMKITTAKFGFLLRKNNHIKMGTIHSSSYFSLS